MEEKKVDPKTPSTNNIGRKDIIKMLSGEDQIVRGFTGK